MLDEVTFAAEYKEHKQEIEALEKKIQNYDDKIENGEELSDDQEEQLARWTKRLSELTELSKEYVRAARRRGLSVPSDLVRTSEEEDRCGLTSEGYLHYYLHKIGFFPAPDKSKDD